MLVDIVERLSNWKHASFRRDGSTLETMMEAADEITSLREQLEIAKKDGERAAITVSDAFNVLQKYLQDDEDYAWSWHCNIAMNAVDAGAPHLEANVVTAGFMRRCFGIDTQHLKQYKPIVSNAMKVKG